ncbi:TonB-dependent receptor domain-containing protein [Kordiimonas sp.]|uniref:TonB-dependent receptor domain-containing protein n=1 Tax=Kordiimonas sp. TaxID=1970157 RepID=UPI003A94F31E
MSKELKKMRRTALLGSAATLLASFALGAGVTGASAQEADTMEDFDLEEVVVTGSRIIRRDVESVSPLSVTSAQDIKLSGFTRIEDLMNSLPQIEAGQTSFIANGASGTANLDLRGMGATRTLVLVNGRRLQPGGIYSQSPDINQIPPALVKRAEVMTGGGASTYGADAVAGVVNFVMDNDFEGLEITAGISGYQHNNDNEYMQGLMDARGFDYPTGSSGIGGKTYNVDIAFGSDFADDKGHVTVYATWRKNEEMRQGERDYSSCALNNAGTSCGGSANAVIPNFDMYPIDPATGNTIYSYHTSGGELVLSDNGYVQALDDDGNPYELPWANADAINNSIGDVYGGGANKFWSLDPNGGFTGASGNLYNYAPVNHFMRPDERWTGGAFVNYEINEHVRPYMEISFMRDRTEAQIAESGTFFAEEYTISCGADFLTAQQIAQACTDWGLGPDDSFAAYVGKRNVEGGPRIDKLEHNSFRIVFGTEGAITDNWHYDASVQYGSTSSSTAYINDFFSTALRPAVEGGSYPVFGYQAITPEIAAGMTGVGVMNGITKQYIANAYVTGDLGFSMPTAESPVAVVLGTEYRKEVFARDADEVFAQGLLLGQGGTTESIKGSYAVKELFAEASIPLVEDASFAKDLTLELGGRLSDYNTSGTNETYKVGLNWTVMDEVKLRASYNRAVRAPNVAELFAPQSTGLWNGTDPCGGDNPSLTQAQCANTGLSAGAYGSPSLISPASQYNGLFGGNPDLDPEIADTWSFGIVANPLEGFRFSVDYWDIQLDQVIGTVPAELTVEQCGLTGLDVFCDNVNRAPNGSLWLGQGNYVQATNINLASRHFRGIDVTADYEMELFTGTLTTKLTGTYMLKKEFTPLPGVDSATYDCVGVTSTDCFAQPEWRHTLRTTYTSDSFWSASVHWRYFGKVGYDGTVDALAADGISAVSYFDLKGTFEINENVGLLVGVNNIFDKEPPLVGGTLSTNANTVAGFYDTLGRYLHASVTVSF